MMHIPRGGRQRRERLRFFKRLGLPRTVFMVLTLMAALNAGLYFFVYKASFEATSDDRSPARATAAPGEPTRNERHAALMPSGELPETATPSEATPSEAEAKAEGGTGEASKDGAGGDEKPVPMNTSQSTPAPVLYTATPAPPTAASSVAQYATAGVAQYATAEASPSSEAAKNRLNRFLPSGIRQLPRMP
jgi:cytoskeletal protein RodZ